MQTTADSARCQAASMQKQPAAVKNQKRRRQMTSSSESCVRSMGNAVARHWISKENRQSADGSGWSGWCPTRKKTSLPASASSALKEKMVLHCFLSLLFCCLSFARFY